MHHHVTVNLSAPDSPPTRLSFAQPTIHIGRVRDRQGGANDVVLAAPRVSGHHAHVVVTADGLTLIDHSANGTLVNGELLTAPRLLAPDDRVEIDAYTLTFELNAARDAPIHTPTAAPLRPPPPAPRLHPPAPSLPPPPHTATPPAPRPPLALVPEDDLPIIPTPSLSTPPCAPSNDDDDDDNATPAPPLPSPDLQRHLHQAQPVAPSPPQGPNTASDPLAALYRELAQLHGAEWGHPPPLRGHDLAQISAVAARAAARYHNLPQGPWPEHLARELCGLGPLAPLLDDPTVTRAVVHGCAPIELHRGAQRELTHLRFSCVEAIHAVLGRSGGAPLGDAPLHITLADGAQIHAWGPAIAPHGPLLVIERPARDAPTLNDLIDQRVLSRPAADLLRRALQRAHNLLFVGPPSADLGPLLVALAAEAPAPLTVLRRAATWPQGQHILLDGHHPAAWSCARRLAVGWLAVDGLTSPDLPELLTLARRPGGGVLATLHAPTAAIALQRLNAALAAGEVNAPRAALAAAFDALITLTADPSGATRVRTIAELRPRGELAELFSWRPDADALEPTTVAPQVLQ